MPVRFPFGARATFRGTSPQDALSVRAVQGLTADGVPIPAGAPTAIGDADIRTATHIFAIGCTLPQAAVSSGKAKDWSDVPPRDLPRPACYRGADSSPHCNGSCRTRWCSDRGPARAGACGSATGACAGAGDAVEEQVASAARLAGALTLAAALTAHRKAAGREGLQMAVNCAL